MQQGRRDTTNQIDVFTSAKHPMVRVTFSYGGGNLDGAVCYSFANMKHFLAHFGAILPLTDCVFHIHTEGK